MAHTAVAHAPTKNSFQPDRPRLTSFEFPRLATIPQNPLMLLFTLLLAITCQSQNLSQTGPSQSTSTARAGSPQSPAPNSVVIPGGTRFALVLTSPVSTRTTHRGDEIHAQFTAPVAVGDEIAIPAGTFVQGPVEKLARKDSRAEIMLQSASLIFPDGYVARIAGPIEVESAEYTAWLNPSGRTMAGVIVAPMAGLGIGALIGNAAHTTTTNNFAGMSMTSASPKGLAIGSIVGLAAGGAVALVLYAHSHQFFVDVGSPLNMTLQEPLTLSQAEVSNAERQAQAHPIATPAIAPRPVPVPSPTAPGSSATCYTPGTPGTPPTVIPGTPGPNGIPGPPTIIPGTPPIPGTPYPCP